MKFLKNWSAKRSGAAMTIEAIDPDTNEQVRLTEIVVIEAGAPFPIARDRDGNEYHLGSAFDRKAA